LCIDQVLQPHVRDGVEIDVCGHCQGVWLDRGEIDKLVGRPDPRQQERPKPRPADEWESPASRDDIWTGQKKKKKKKKKSLGDRLGDLLEDALDL
jgi:Zn-finger nucleic acid-binding protein